MANNTAAQVQKHEKDTGSLEVQIAQLTAKISSLTEHLKINKKDFACRRSLLQKVAKRKTFLRYLRKHDEQSYKNVISVLNLKR